MPQLPSITDQAFDEKVKPCERLQVQGDAPGIAAIIEGLKANHTLTEHQRAVCLDWLSCANWLDQDYEGALELISKALTIAESLKNRRLAARLITHTGQIRSDAGDDGAAIAHFLDALDRFAELNDLEGKRRICDLLAKLYLRMEHVINARMYLQDMLEIDRKTGDRKAEAATLSAIGATHASLDENDEAIRYYEQAQAISKELGDQYGVARELHNIGNAHGAEGDTGRAEKAVRQALDIARELNSDYGLSVCLLSLGRIELHKRRLAEAIELLEESVNILQKMGFWEREAVAKAHLAMARFEKGELLKCLQLADEVLQACSALGKEHAFPVSMAYGVKARCAHTAGRKEDATHFAQKAMDSMGERSRINLSDGNRHSKILKDWLGEVLDA